MRKKFEQQLTIGVIPISEVEFDEKSRHELPEILKGLKHIFVSPEINEVVFDLLDAKINSDKKKPGRLGMSLWEILVIGAVRLALNIDYDELQDLCNNHQKLREILGVGTSDFKMHKHYPLNTIKDNVKLLDSELLDSINKEVVKAGHRIIKKKEDLAPKDKLALNIRGDSYVLESNIHFPTDLSLLWDSCRKVSDLLRDLGFHLTGHRQIVSLKKKIKSNYRISSEIHRKKGGNYEKRLSESVKLYLSKAEELLLKCNYSLQTLLVQVQSGSFKKQPSIAKKIKALAHYRVYLEKHIDLVDRRLLKGEIIPHSEKVFSIFELEVEWISKGKAGKAVEFGHRHLIYTDQYQFILSHQVLENKTDKEVALSAGKKIVVDYGQDDYHFASLSYDRGFYSQLAKAGLKKLYSEVIMPKSGKKNKAEQEEESSESFRQLCHHHSGVEGNINSLEHTGLDKCPDKGLQSFKNYAALGVLAYNLRQLGKWVKKEEQAQKAALEKIRKKTA